MALTFTDKAANEMEERVDKLLPYGYVDVWISTFHSFGERVLREHALEIGLNSNFKLLSGPEQWLLVRQNLDKFDLDYYKPLGNPSRFVYALIQHFSRVKDENISPDEYLKFAEKNLKKYGLKKTKKQDVNIENAKKTLEVAGAFKKYNELLLEQGDLDFGDLILYTLQLFQKRASILDLYRKKFKYILVDEFQDTNFAQYELLKLLAEPKNNLTVCGDDDQSIYKFRGAAISNILEFKKDFSKSREVVLIKNYRSKQNILDLAYDFIQLNNPNRLEARLSASVLDDKGQPLATKISKKLASQNKGLGKIRLMKAKTAEDEVINVLREILALKNKNHKLSWNDFAILVRANSQADIFVNTFSNQDIPYQFVAARGLYQKPEIMDLIAYLKLLDNYHESAALYRVLSMKVFDFETREIIKLLNYTYQKRISLFETLERAKNVPNLEEKTLKSIEKFLDLIKNQSELSKTKSVSLVLYEFIKQTNLIETIQKKEKEAENKILNISKFYKKVEEFEQQNTDKSVKAFVSELNLILEVGEDPRPADLQEGPEAVKIMTAHGAKGLEFEYVFVTNLADKRFPTIERREQIEVPDQLVKEILLEGDMHLEEERRLFYVAMTRAKTGLYFSYADNYGGVRKKKPSRFLYEIKMAKEEKDEEEAQQFLDLTFSQATKIEKEKELASVKLPEKFSFTQLKAFETCPKQYRFAHILMVPTLGRHAFSFGKSIHNTLHEFYSRIQKGKIPTKDELLKIYETNWIDDWYETKDHEKQRKESGLKALENFYEFNKKSFQKAPKYLEQPFNIKIGEYTIKGFIDRVDEIGDDQVEIIDYKTGNLPKSDKQMDLEQLLIYALACEEVFKEEPALVTYYYIEDNKKFSFQPTEEAKEEIRERVQKTIAEIMRSDFKATPSWKCKFCDFYQICDDRMVVNG